MNSIKRFLIFFLCLGIFFSHSLSSQYQGNKSELTKTEKDRLIEISNGLFIKRPDIALSISTSDITPSYENIPDPIEYDQIYLDSLLNVLEENKSNSLILSKIAGYYSEKEQSLLANSYYERAFENLDINYFKDSAAFFSNRAVLKNRLGKKDAIEDLKKSLEINPNDSLAIQIYPMLLMQDDEYEKAREALWYALENGYGGKRMTYLKLTALEITEAGKRISTLQGKGVNVKKRYRDKNYNEIIDFSLIDKYEKMNPNKLEIFWTNKSAHIVGLFSKMTFLARFENDSIEFPFTPYDREKIQSLIREFTEASGPEAINAYSRNRCLGYLYFLNGDQGNSMTYFKRAMEVFPEEKRDITFNTDDCQYMMMLLYILDSDTENYRSAIRNKIENEPDESKSVDDLMLLAYDYFQNEEIQQADDLCKEVMLIDSNHFSTLRLKSHLSFLAGETQLALFYLENAGKNLTDPSQEYNLTLQYAIYLIYDGNSDMARSVLESLQASRGSQGCPECDTLIKEFCR